MLKKTHYIENRTYNNKTIPTAFIIYILPKKNIKNQIVITFFSVLTEQY